MRTTRAVWMLAIVATLLAGVSSGCSGLGTSGRNSTASSGAVAPTTDVAAKDGAAVSGDVVPGESALRATPDASVSMQDTLIVSTAGISVEVKNLDVAVAAIRDLSTKYGATIANLSVSAGMESGMNPQPLDDPSAQYSSPTPGGATITLRIPSDKLASAEKEIAGLGRVVLQSSSQDDVTQQHVDMKARLKNLQAEEARLRTFFLKAKRVSEMLSIETELARVRGEIESMQAQIAYLERQAALATLTVSLSQPGALVSPAAGGWGFSAAIRDGVRAAASVTRGLITTVLAFSPILLLGLVLFIVIRALVVRRRTRRANATASHAEPIEPDATDSDALPTQR